MTPKQEVLEAISKSVEHPGEWVTFLRWKALATEDTITVEHPPGDGHIVQSAVGDHRPVLSTTETSLTYRRPTFEESKAAIMRITDRILYGGA